MKIWSDAKLELTLSELRSIKANYEKHILDDQDSYDIDEFISALESLKEAKRILVLHESIADELRELSEAFDGK
jgi:hypothetical protein